MWRQGRSRWWRGYQASRAEARKEGREGSFVKILKENKLDPDFVSAGRLVKQKNGVTFVAPIRGRTAYQAKAYAGIRDFFA